ncbi:MAG: FkbM family methyltransferase [Ferruginibacter sp.]
MKKLVQKIIGKQNYTRLEGLKKRFWPTPFDKQQQQFLKEQIQFYGGLIKPNDLCFDIGGNVGFKTNVFLHLGARVVTLEPQQACVDILKIKYGKKAIILQKGAGATNEMKEFYISNNTAVSSFKKDWVDEFKDSRFPGSSIQAVEKIEMVTLDSLIDIYGKPNFIKIDVEGFEMEVFRGLTNSFGYLSFEYAVPEKAQDVTEILKYLKSKYSRLTCNFAICNDSSFALKAWMPIAEMLEYVQQEYFNSTFAGDIYIKT